ncbi:periplasmic heavy metal sensor [Trinickia terrae]|uniref:Periplasmic heavy metal sensor n=1 Tax=Trinickia terrae TaxID=2571161 RepID=A0A4U1IC58_9BURK|nr:periplasmic heavy metal sensor [Trinickia terrae]TKC91193.1 periplasmic heavy metal sensor [Trinickia terrae]
MTGRAWKAVLIGSLVLNVFLLGSVAGGAYQLLTEHREQKTAAAQQQPRALRFAAENLGSDREQQFIDALKDARREVRDQAREGREGRREVLQALAAPQFDRAALDAALAKTRNADIAQRTRVEQGVADFAATLTPEERVKFAGSLKEVGQWRQAQAASAAKGASQ